MQFHLKYISPQFGAVLQLAMECDDTLQRWPIDIFINLSIYFVLLEVLPKKEKLYSFSSLFLLYY